MSHAQEPRIPLLPTLMTAGNILCGFVAILQIFDGRHYEVNLHYHYAIVFILLACVFDALDGRVARMGGTESPFGRELDSLADIVSFGVAPALLVHDIVLKEIDTPKGLGWLISCVYLVCGAMRLARFNCLAAMDTKSSSKSFRGCPIPAAAGVISSLTLLIIWLDSNEREIGHWKYVLAGLMALLSYLMVSDLEYPSFMADEALVPLGHHQHRGHRLHRHELALDAFDHLRQLPALRTGASLGLPQMAAGD